MDLALGTIQRGEGSSLSATHEASQGEVMDLQAQVQAQAKEIEQLSNDKMCLEAENTQLKMTLLHRTLTSSIVCCIRSHRDAL